jgi:hypothetical protein
MLQSELDKKKAKISKFNEELDYLDDQISGLLKESTKLGLQLSSVEQGGEESVAAAEEKLRQKIKNIKETIDGMKQNRREFKEMIEELGKEVSAAEKNVVPDPVPAHAESSNIPIRSKISVAGSTSPSIAAAQNALHDEYGSVDGFDSLKIGVKSSTTRGPAGSQKGSERPSAVDSSVNNRHESASTHSGNSKVSSTVTGIGQVANRNVIERTAEQIALHSALTDSRDDAQKSGIGQAGVRNIVAVDQTAPRQKRDLVQTGIGKVPDWIKKKQEEKEKAKLKG